MVDDATLAVLTANSDAAEASTDWPAASWDALARADVTGWALPREHGGSNRDPVEILDGYGRLASACLTTTFILTQYDAAVRRLRSFASPEVQAKLFPALLAGGRYATVGISQLTTSRQHTAPAVTASPIPCGGYLLDGVVPWVTGADAAAVMVCGGIKPDGKQVLCRLSLPRGGVSPGPPLPLAALCGSRTTAVTLDGVVVAPEEVLAGPTERPLTTGRGGTGGLETSCLALGLAGAAAGMLRDEAARRPELAEAADRFTAAQTNLVNRMKRLASGDSVAPEELVAVRVAANRLVLNATQAALTVTKGAGFVAPHPAQRLARQALFFLVWSCPRPAAEGLLTQLMPDTAD